MSGALEQTSELVGGVEMVFHEQDAERTRSCNVRMRIARRFYFARCWRTHSGESNRDFRPFVTTFAHRRDRAGMQFHDCPADGKAKTQSSKYAAPRTLALFKRMKNS